MHGATYGCTFFMRDFKLDIFDNFIRAVTQVILSEKSYATMYACNIWLLWYHAWRDASLPWWKNVWLDVWFNKEPLRSLTILEDSLKNLEEKIYEKFESCQESRRLVKIFKKTQNSKLGIQYEINWVEKQIKFESRVVLILKKGRTKTGHPQSELKKTNFMKIKERTLEVVDRACKNPDTLGPLGPSDNGCRKYEQPIELGE